MFLGSYVGQVSRSWLTIFKQAYPQTYIIHAKKKSVSICQVQSPLIKIDSGLQ